MHARPQIRTTQPSGHVGVAGSPITQDMLFAGYPIGNNFWDAVNGRNMTLVVGTAGTCASTEYAGNVLATRLTSANAQWFSSPIQGIPAGHNAITVAALCYVLSNNSQYGVAFVENTSGDPARIGILSGAGGSNIFQLSQQWGGGASHTVNGTRARVVRYAYLAVVRQIALDSRDIWVNGFKEGSGTGVATSVSVVVNNMHIGVRRRDSAADPMNGGCMFAAAWKRALTDTEIVDLYQRTPWQVFAPNRRRMFVSAGSALAYTLTANKADFTLSAQAAALKAARRLVAAKADYTLSAQSAGLKKGFNTPAAYAPFTLSAQAAGLYAARRLTANKADYTLSAQAAGLKKGFRLNAQFGAFSFSPQDVTFHGSRIMVANHATYTLSVQAAALRAARALPCSYAPFTLSGQAAGLKGGRRLAANHATYTLTARAAGLDYSAAPPAPEVEQGKHMLDSVGRMMR